MDLIIPLIIGFLGSLHDKKMCGTTTGMLQLNRQNNFGRISNALLYHSGRLISYILLGIFFGMFGRGLRLAGFQQWTSILLGSALVVGTLYPVIFKEQIGVSGLFKGLSNRLTDSSRKQAAERNYLHFLKIGILSGLLPCGLVYIAIAGAIVTGEVWSGSLFMVFYGIGTIPLLLFPENNIEQPGRSRMKRVVPYFIFMLGLLFILRGMSLGIPYLSPTPEKLVSKMIIVKGNCCN